MTAPKTDARRRHDPDVRGFASDNYAGVHPEVLAALALANGGHQVAYGEDAYTENLQGIIRGHFGATAEAFPVFNGTGANVVALQAVTDRWGAVVCAESAHINVDEGGAPERMGGIKLLTVPTPDGKLTPELIDRQAWGWADEHRAMPLVVSITQTTELGTLYTPDEIRAICEHAHARGMRVHVDGSRIANAAASLDMPMRAFTTGVGVDILSFGGTKNGALFGRGGRRAQPGCRQPHEAPAQAVDAARLQDALRVGAAGSAARRRPVAAQRQARERDGDAPRRRGASGGRGAGPASGAGQRGLRPAAARRQRAAAAARSGSTSGTRPPARCAGCARSTPPRPTSTRFVAALKEEMAR